MATLSLVITIVGWIFLILGWVMKLSYNRKKDELKMGVSIACFFMSIVLFLISIVLLVLI